MLHNTRGIVLRSTKYGETSLILSIFTELKGVQSYMIKGVRSDKAKTKRAGILHHAALLDLVVEHKANRQLQHIKEFQPHYLYQSIQEEVVKNSIATFAVELLYKMLPKEEEMTSLFDFVISFFKQLDQADNSNIANLPLFFTIQCGKMFGYNINGTYSQASPYANAIEGSFTEHLPTIADKLYDEEVILLADFLLEAKENHLPTVQMNAYQRVKILEWYIKFLQHHTQHLGAMKSIEILKTILH